MSNFNEAAYRENQANKAHMQEDRVNGQRVIIVDTNKTTYQGQKVRDLSAAGRKKFDNLTYITNASHTDGPVKIIYR